MSSWCWERLRQAFGQPDGELPSLSEGLSRVEVLAEAVALTIVPPADLSIERLRKRCPDDQLKETSIGQVRITIAVRPVFRGGRTWMVTPDGRQGRAPRAPDPTLVKALVSAHAKLGACGLSTLTATSALQTSKSASDSYQRRLIRLAFLAPDIQRAILQGCQPIGLTLQQLMERNIPAAWDTQRRAFGF